MNVTSIHAITAMVSLISLAEFEVMCMFKALHKDTAYVHPYQGISREEFYSFYEVQGMRWKQVGHNMMCGTQCLSQ